MPQRSRSLRGRIVQFDVEPQAHDAWRAAGERVDMIVQRAKYAATSYGRFDVNALDPPELAVAPVAPFVRDHELADRTARVVFGDEIAAMPGFSRTAATPRRIVAGSSRLCSVSSAIASLPWARNSWSEGLASRIRTFMRQSYRARKTAVAVRQPGATMRALVWGGSSAGRASRSQCEGRGFDPLPLHHFFSGPAATDRTACPGSSVDRATAS